MEDPSLGLIDIGLLGREHPSQGSLVDGDPGSFAKEEAKGVELKRAITLCPNSKCHLSPIIYLNLHIPHASKSEIMKANKSFMVFHGILSEFRQFSLNWSLGEIKLKNILPWKTVRIIIHLNYVLFQIPYNKKCKWVNTDSVFLVLLSIVILFFYISMTFEKNHYIWTTLTDLCLCNKELSVVLH